MGGRGSSSGKQSGRGTGLSRAERERLAAEARQREEAAQRAAEEARRREEAARERERKERAANAATQEQARTYKQVQEHGFDNAAQLQAFINQRYWGDGVSDRRKSSAFTVEDAPSFAGKNAAVIRMGDRNETLTFLQYLKNDMNVLVEQWEGDAFSRHSSHIVYLNRRADGSRKRKLKAK